MTAAEKLTSLSSLTGCATAAEHFCSITQSGMNIYIPVEEQLGEVLNNDPIVGSVETIVEVFGEIEPTKEIQGFVEPDEPLNETNNPNEIEGTTQCQ